MMWIVDILASELFWGLGVGHDGLDYLMAKWIDTGEVDYFVSTVVDGYVQRMKG